MLRTRVCLLCWRPRVDWSQYFCRVKEATWRTKIGQMTKAAHAVTGGTTTLAAADKVEAGRRVPMIGIGTSVMIGGTTVGSVMIGGTIVLMVIGIGISVMIAGTIVPMVTGIGISVMIGVITVPMVIVIEIGGMIAGIIVGSVMIVGTIVLMVIGIGISVMIVGTTAVVVTIVVMTVAITAGAIVGIGATSSHGLPGSAQTGVAKIAAMTDLAARSRSHTRLNTVQQTLTSP